MHEPSLSLSIFNTLTIKLTWFVDHLFCYHFEAPLISVNYLEDVILKLIFFTYERKIILLVDNFLQVWRAWIQRLICNIVNWVITCEGIFFFKFFAGGGITWTFIIVFLTGIQVDLIQDSFSLVFRNFIIFIELFGWRLLNLVLGLLLLLDGLSVLFWGLGWSIFLIIATIIHNII